MGMTRGDTGSRISSHHFDLLTMKKIVEGHRMCSGIKRERMCLSGAGELRDICQRWELVTRAGRSS